MSKKLMVFADNIYQAFMFWLVIAPAALVYSLCEDGASCLRQPGRSISITLLSTDNWDPLVWVKLAFKAVFRVIRDLLETLTWLNIGPKVVGFEPIGWQEWVDTYKPHRDRQGVVRLYRDFGNDLDFIRLIDAKYVWTECESNGEFYTDPGVRRVNVFGYYITEKPWANPEMQVQNEE